MSDKAQPVQTIERVAALAMQLGSRHLADYGATRSRHDFTQRQLMACLILRAYTKTTYRGLLELLAISPSLRHELGLRDKLPHYSTLAKFSSCSQVLEIADAMIRSIEQAAFRQTTEPPAAANPPAQANHPLPRIRLVAQRIEPTEPATPVFPAARPDPTLREMVARWRSGKLGLTPLKPTHSL